MIAREELERIRNLVDISDLISKSGVTLKSAGTNSVKGLCPFHDEKSPSFTVRPSIGRYNCFGCGETGDIFQFIQRLNNMTFSESIMYIADMYGIEVEETANEENRGPSRKSLYEVMSAAYSYYEEQYGKLSESHPARQELIKRDLGIFRDGIGYAPEGWTHLYDHLKERNFTDEVILGAGLAMQSESGSIYDMFRGRLLWSIKDVTGKIIGFGARRLFETDKNPGKYINTPETALYRKSNVLYNLDIARTVAAKEKKIYVVEGYTDVMAFKAAGINNVVASCGTAFGEAHASMVRRIVSESGSIIFCFDGDDAGMKAARKTFELKTPIHVRSRAVLFDSGDPCDLRMSEGNDGLLKALENDAPLIEFVLKYEMRPHDLTTPEGRSAYLKTATSLLSDINDLSLRDDYMRRVTLWAGSTVDVVSRMVTQQRRAYRNEVPDIEHIYEGEIEVEVKKESTLFKRQLSLLGLLYQFPDAGAKNHPDVRIELFDDTMVSLAEEIINNLDNPAAILKLRPEKTSNSELAIRALTETFPGVERALQTGRSEIDAASRVLKVLVRNILALQQDEKKRLVRATVSSTVQNRQADDLTLLEDITEIYKR